MLLGVKQTLGSSDIYNGIRCWPRRTADSLGHRSPVVIHPNASCDTHRLSRARRKAHVPPLAKSSTLVVSGLPASETQRDQLERPQRQRHGPIAVSHKCGRLDRSLEQVGLCSGVPVKPGGDCGA